jgi:hypothetical protein
MPLMIACAPSAIVCRPLEQKRFTVMAETSTGNPARSTARRAWFNPCPASGMAQPQITSSIMDASNFTRSATAFITVALRSTGCTEASDPSFLPRATALRAALTITTSIAIVSVSVM